MLSVFKVLRYTGIHKQWRSQPFAHGQHADRAWRRFFAARRRDCGSALRSVGRTAGGALQLRANTHPQKVASECVSITARCVYAFSLLRIIYFMSQWGKIIIRTNQPRGPIREQQVAYQLWEAIRAEIAWWVLVHSASETPGPCAPTWWPNWRCDVRLLIPFLSPQLFPLQPVLLEHGTLQTLKVSMRQNLPPGATLTLLDTCFYAYTIDRICYY